MFCSKRLLFFMWGPLKHTVLVSQSDAHLGEPQVKPSLAWAATDHPPQRADREGGCGRRTTENTGRKHTASHAVHEHQKVKSRTNTVYQLQLHGRMSRQEYIFIWKRPGMWIDSFMEQEFCYTRFFLLIFAWSQFPKRPAMNQALEDHGSNEINLKLVLKPVRETVKTQRKRKKMGKGRTEGRRKN